VLQKQSEADIFRGETSYMASEVIFRGAGCKIGCKCK